jgi:hypothetical protein
MVPPNSNLAVVPSAYDTHDDDETTLHRRLADFNRTRLSPSVPSGNWGQHLKREIRLRTMEAEYAEKERTAVARAALQAPTEPDAFVAWFEDLKDTGPGQHDALFPFLAEQASLFEMKWFLNQEMAGEAGFDDLVALTQVKLPRQAKLELARNYWDEMGQGNEGGMHGPMLEHLGAKLGLDGAGVVWESQALGNLMVALAANRHYAYQSVGALGVIELTAPGRAQKVNQGMKRLGLGGDVRRYFALHATLDVRHSASWNREVLRPLVAADPNTAPAIAEGALMRLRAGARCFERYRRELGFVHPIQWRIGIVEDST